MLFPGIQAIEGSTLGADAPACAVVGMGRCVGPVRRAASDAGLATVWFPEMEALLRRPPAGLSLVVLAPSLTRSEPELAPPPSGPVAAVPLMAVIADGGLAHVELPQSTESLETFRFPLEREQFMAAAVEAVGEPLARP